MNGLVNEQEKQWQNKLVKLQLTHLDSILTVLLSSSRGGARNFLTGGANIQFSWYYNCQKSPKKLLFTFRRGSSMLQGDYSSLALPWRHPCPAVSFSALSWQPTHSCCEVKVRCNVAEEPGRQKKSLTTIPQSTDVVLFLSVQICRLGSFH